MKILIISPTHKGIGGIAQNVQGISEFLKHTEHEVDVISSDNTFTIPIRGLKNLSFMFSSYLKTKFKKNYDIVHGFNLPSTLPMKNIKGKKILTIHGIYSNQLEHIHGTLKGKTTRFEKDAIGWVDFLTVGSKEALEFYSKDFTKVKYIPNALNISSLPQKSSSLYEKQIIFAGRLSKEKGIFSILKIAKKIPKGMHFIVVGTGPEEEHVKKTAEEIENFHFLGYKSHDETIELIRGSNIIVQPSLIEAISSTLLEAMACKTPIITSNLGGNKELIDNYQTGILIDPQSYEEILQKIIELINDKQLINKLTVNALKEVEKYDWKIIGKIYLKLYEELLKSN